jgi:hypothetical protein
MSLSIEQEMEIATSTVAATIAVNEQMLANLIANSFYEQEDPTIQAGIQFINLLRADLSAMTL